MLKLNAKSFYDLSKGQKLFFVFDYDGTLASINPKDNDNFYPEEKKELLNRFAQNNKVAILTGRSYNNFKRMVAQEINPEIMIFGTHGAEINAAASSRPNEKEINSIKERFINESGTEIEEKELSITIHYKKHDNPESILEALHNEFSKYEDIFRIQEGFKYFEFLPKHINKGTAIDYLAKEFPAHRIVFFGDDLTDNDAFARVNHYNGISIQVGERIPDSKRVAEHKVSDISAVYEIIQKGILNEV